MSPKELYNIILTYGIPEVEVREFFTYEFITICDLSYDFKAALFDIDEEIFYEEIERAAYKTNGWLLAAYSGG
jgi:hypothetical protein